MLALEQRVDVFEIMEAEAQAALTGESKVTDHFSVRHVASCPRTIWFRAHQVPYSNPPKLSTVIMMEWGTGAEEAEFGRLANLEPEQLGNSMEITDALDKFPKLKHHVEQAADIWQGQFMEIGRNAIHGLPLHFEWPGVKRSIHGVVDIILLMHDHPVVIEIKETKGQSASNIRAGGGPWSSWVAQLYTYCQELELPGELHVWGRDTGYHTKFILDERRGQICLNGAPYTFDTNVGKLRPREYVTLRLSYLEDVMGRDKPPGKARILAGGKVIEPVFDDCPMPEDEIYRLTVSQRGTVGNEVSYKGDKWKSRRCNKCWDRDNCMGEVIERLRAGLKKKEN